MLKSAETATKNFSLYRKAIDPTTGVTYGDVTSVVWGNAAVWGSTRGVCEG